MVPVDVAEAAVAANESVIVAGAVIVAIVVPAAIPGPLTSIPTASPVNADTPVTAVLPRVRKPPKVIVPGSFGSTSMGSVPIKMSVCVLVKVGAWDRVAVPSDCETISTEEIVRACAAGTVPAGVVTAIFWYDTLVNVVDEMMLRLAPISWGPAAAEGSVDITIELVDGLTLVIIVPEAIFGPVIGAPADR
jgi:hypothetical protein